MGFQNAPIQRKLMTMILGTSGVVLLLTCATFLTYEIFVFRGGAVRQLSTIGQIIATNSTAAVAFDNEADAAEILAALKAERHVVAACLYGRQGKLLARYPAEAPTRIFPATPGPEGYHLTGGHIVGFAPVVQIKGLRLGTLYLNSDLEEMYDRLRLYAGLSALVIAVSSLVAYALSRKLHKQISIPILALADTAKAVSDRRDYSVRTRKFGEDELGLLTDALNHMLGQIENQSLALQAQVGRLSLLHQITSAIGERQDLQSIFEVALRSVKENLPIDFGCIYLYDQTSRTLTLARSDAKTSSLKEEFSKAEPAVISIEESGFLPCLEGEVTYKKDLSQSVEPFARRLFRNGMKCLVAAPLRVESKIFGIFIAVRSEAKSFSHNDCEFLRHLSEHVALAANQTQVYTHLQQAYEDLRQTQQTVLQQERLRALGQMASGIAHDINNALSPASLYTESVLAKDASLSPKSREYLTIAQRAIDDVAQTVGRLREFYRQREPQLVLTPIDINKLVDQVIDLTRARWYDMAQQREVCIEMKRELAPLIPAIMGVESEIREALTNLIFNAVDAMPVGGTLTLITRLVADKGAEVKLLSSLHVSVEVRDTGIGMDAETKRRCLEPFFTTKGDRGTGLGLAMVYGTARRHTAEIEIESSPGMGTTVALNFPVPLESPELPTHSPRRVFQLPRLRLLVVDDDIVLLKSLRDTLEDDGHEVVAAEGGQSGIDVFIEAQESVRPFAAVITDLGMPRVDGRRVANAVKSRSPSTPVFLLSGWGQGIAADGEIPANIDRVLNKPAKLSELRDVLASVKASSL